MIQRIPVLILALSGLLITIVSAFFSIHGFIMFIPDKTLFLGILGLGIAFELAKITGSTFLFHRMKDSTFPLMFKIYLSLAVLSLIVFSAIFTFVHLNAAVSSSMVENNVVQTNIDNLTQRNAEIQLSIKQMDKQVADLPADYVKARIKLMNEFAPIKEKLNEEYMRNNVSLQQLQTSTVKDDKFIFLTNLSKFTGVSREHIFSYVILFIVITIDPLAISLFLASSHILSEIKEKSKQEVSEEATSSFHNPLTPSMNFSEEKIDEISKDAEVERELMEEITDDIEEDLLEAEASLMSRKKLTPTQIRHKLSQENHV